MTQPSSCEDNADANMQNVLDEAQQLMDTLGMSSDYSENDQELSESIVIDGFAIDSDDEEEAVQVKTDGDSASININQRPPETLMPSDSLSDPPQEKASDANGTAGIQQASLHPLHEDVLVSPPTPTPSTPNTGTYPPSLPSNTHSFDFKAKTSLFASNLATFAQKAASQVADQISTTGSSTVTPIPISPHNLPEPSITVEMDKEQKAKLLHAHVGSLLPGERVIMFLQNLLHVSNSSTTSPIHGNWCCCMTYYRMILFCIDDDCHADTVPSEWNVHVWSLPESPKLLQIPLASIDKVEKSVYTKPSNHTLMGLVIYG